MYWIEPALELSPEEHWWWPVTSKMQPSSLQHFEHCHPAGSSRSSQWTHSSPGLTTSWFDILEETIPPGCCRVGWRQEWADWWEAAERRQLALADPQHHSGTGLCLTLQSKGKASQLPATRAAWRIAATIQPFETQSAVSHNHKEPVSQCGSGQCYGTGATSTSRQAVADRSWNRTPQQPKRGWWEARDQGPRRHSTFPGADPGVKFSSSLLHHLGKWWKKINKNGDPCFKQLHGLQCYTWPGKYFALSEASDTSQRAGLYRADATDKSVQPAIFWDHALGEYKNNMDSKAM